MPVRKPCIMQNNDFYLLDNAPTVSVCNLDPSRDSHAFASKHNAVLSTPPDTATPTTESTDDVSRLGELSPLTWDRKAVRNAISNLCSVTAVATARRAMPALAELSR
jgi:hypothetical protein